MSKDLEQKTIDAAHAILSGILQQITEQQDSTSVLLDFIVHIESFRKTALLRETSENLSVSHGEGKKNVDPKMITVEEMRLTTRVYHMLKRGELHTLYDILKTGSDSIAEKKSVGPKILDELDGKVRDFGYILNKKGITD